MSIKEIYRENKLHSFKINIQLRSKKHPHLREQKQLTLCAKTHSMKRVEQIEKSLSYDVYARLKEKEGRDMDFSTLLNLWYENKIKTSEVTKETAGDYHRAIEKWCYNLLSKACNEIRMQEIKKILLFQKDEGISRSYRRKFKSMINNVFNYGIEEGYLIETLRSPTYGIKLEKETEKRPEILSRKQIRTFLESAKYMNHPWYPVWAFAVLSGCRNGEIYALKKSEIDLENNKIFIAYSYNNRRREISKTKSGYYRHVPMNKQLRGLVIEHISRDPESEFLFERLQGWNKGYQAKILRTFLTGIRLPSVKFHTLRACFATQLLQQGKAPAVVMKVCGWRDLKTMERYVRLAGIDEKGATDGLDLLPSLDGNDLLSINTY